MPEKTKMHAMFEVWMVVYKDTERNRWHPCYDCGLFRTKSEAEDRRCRHHAADGIPTDTVEVYPKSTS